jgi:hypothetical protein
MHVLYWVASLDSTRISYAYQNLTYYFFFCQSYLCQDVFIVTKYPTPDVAVFFLHMLTECKSDTVVCMDSLDDLEFVCILYFMNYSN